MKSLTRMAVIVAAIAVGGAAAKTGEVVGQISAWPARPGPVKKGESAYKPIKGTVVILDQQRRVVATVASDEAGAFRAALPPGRYMLTLQESAEPHMGKAHGPVEVVVEAGKTVHARVVFDTGLR